MKSKERLGKGKYMNSLKNCSRQFETINTLKNLKNQPQTIEIFN